MSIKKMEDKAVKNKVEKKEPRFYRRLKARKSEVLSTLVNLFFTERSTLKDPDGPEADAAFTHYRNMWLEEVTNFNRSNNKPFSLRGEAFTEEVTRLIEMEKNAKRNKAAEKETKDFQHFMRRKAGWKNNFFRHLWYYILSFGDEAKINHRWKHYYITLL